MKQKKQKILIELNDKNTLINKLNTSNKEHAQNIQRLKNELNDKEISLDEYKRRLDTLINTYEIQIKKLKEEIKKSKEYVSSDEKI